MLDDGFTMLRVVAVGVTGDQHTRTLDVCVHPFTVGGGSPRQRDCARYAGR